MTADLGPAATPRPIPGAPRRLRTQAERHTDDHTWRSTAASRPNFATYPDTPAGSPSWWLREANPALGIPVNPEVLGNALDGPAPVDGETCKRWCGFCHVGTGEQPPSPHLATGGIVPGTAGSDLVSMPLGGCTLTLPPVPPRRRWWHRYTRRAQ